MHEVGLRAELGIQLQCAGQLLSAMLEQQFWRIAEWVDTGLKGRLVYRELLLVRVAAATSCPTLACTRPPR